MGWANNNEMALPSHNSTQSSFLDSGHARLNELGYKQELKRDLSVLSNFAFSFSIISVITGITTLYNTGLKFGGPVAIVYGWVITGCFTMIVGLSMAEICSSYPTSGGLYYWSAKLAGPNWAPFASWITGWFNIVGQWAVTTSVNYSLAELIQVIILLSTGGKNGGGYEASKYVVIAIHAGLLLVHAIINSLSISWLSFFGQLAAGWNILGVFVIMILVPCVATEKASTKFVFTHFNTDNGDGVNGRLYIFLLGLLMSQYTLTGYDASAHMSEETRDADINGPKGIISSIGISIIVGWGYILGITFAVTDVPFLLDENNDSGGYAIAEVFYRAFNNRYGSGVGGIICLGVVAVAIFFCAMSSVTSNSRMVYAFSRDGAMPLSSLWHKVNSQEVPLNAVWLSAFISFCMALTADPNEDLEPLFDYSRVQPLDPINLDDDDEDDSNPFPHKKQKLSDGDKLSDVKGVQDVIQINDGEDKDEEDWLPSPVRVPMDAKNREEDSIIKAIRLKKQELLSYAQSAEEILQSGEDSGKNDQNTLLQCTAEPLPKPPSERTKIIICIQDKDELKHFRVYMDDKFEKLFKMYADKVKLDIQKLAFSFDGDKISPTATPADLGMEDDDIIEVHVKAS